jgi:hypothetical protein
MRLTSKLHFLLFVCLAPLACAGCGKEDSQLAPVHGTVTYRKEPLKGGTIVFAPDADRGARGPMARAEIKPDGTYILITGPDNGCVPGWHRITIMGANQTQGTTLSLPRDFLKFGDPDTSGLSREVKVGEDNKIDLELN